MGESLCHEHLRIVLLVLLGCLRLSLTVQKVQLILLEQVSLLLKRVTVFHFLILFIIVILVVGHGGLLLFGVGCFVPLCLLLGLLDFLLFVWLGVAVL